ncbi:MFS transporter [Novosphingobium sp. G106]|uniref:MFS transporter n=1 Tax=Novosphingobium sp. G106 TaxID=2849500 RepID=UPI001C2CEE03|nr:MFS transporter [Novosphingobium sp. G106]MBV1688975.1 MFS transporter [Novosphingobium sp. G106]
MTGVRTDRAALRPPVPLGNESAAPTAAEVIEEWRRQWRPGLAAFVAGAVGVSLWPSVSSLFVTPLQHEFGWSRSEVAFAFNASMIIAFASPQLGRMVDRFGPRIMLLGSLSSMLVGYVALASLWASLTAFYLLYLFTMLVGTCNGGMSFNRVISTSFARSRGLALAISRSGMAAASAIMPPVLYLIISEAGWRAGFLALGSLILFVALPMVYFLVPGRSSEQRSEAQSAAAGRTSTWRLLAHRKVLLLCAAAGLGYAPCIALLQQFQPILVDKGVLPLTAASFIGVLGGAAFFGGLLSGALVDRFWAPLVTCGAMVIGVAGCLFLLPQSIETGAALAGAIAIGAAQGAQMPVIAFLIARYMGFSSYSAIFGLCVFVIGMLIPVYISAMTHLYEWLGGHQAGLGLCISSFVAAVAAILAMGRYPEIPEIT